MRPLIDTSQMMPDFSIYLVVSGLAYAMSVIGFVLSLVGGYEYVKKDKTKLFLWGLYLLGIGICINIINAVFFMSAMRSGSNVIEIHN